MVAIFGIAILVIGLSGCGGSTTSQADKNENTSQTDTTDNSSAAVGSVDKACSDSRKAFTAGVTAEESMALLSDAYFFFRDASLNNPAFTIYAEGASAAYGLTPKYLLTSSMYSTAKNGGGTYMSSADAKRINSLMSFCGF